MDKLGRFTGCMLGGAAGDALGYLIEYADLKTIHKKYGPYGLRTVLKLEANGKRGIISDDTQMALFTADGMLWAQHDGLSPEEGLYRAYMRWYYTQTERIIRPDQAGWMKKQSHEEDLKYDMMGNPLLFARRAPGKSCLIALASGTQFTKEKKANACKSSTALRTAPIGLFYAGDVDKAFAVGCQAALLTHGNETAYLAAGTLSAIISQLADEKPLGQALTTAFGRLQQEEGGIALWKTLQTAVDEAMSDRNPVRSMKKLGLGWNADEALALSLYCVMKSPSLKDAVIMACNQDGDSDTCGAVSGYIAGAIYGEKSVPKNWLAHMECLDLLHTMAERLYTCSGTAEDTEGTEK